MNRPPSQRVKTYSEVMNEWNEQRSFVMSTRSRILHPRWDSPWPVRVYGYLWRLSVVVLVPSAVFLYLVKDHVRTKAFREQMEKGVISYFNAPSGKVDGTSWRMETGNLMFKQVEVRDSPWFERLEALDTITAMPLWEVFRKKWIFRRLSIGEISVALKSGAAGEVPTYEFNEDDLDPSRLRSAPLMKGGEGAPAPPLPTRVKLQRGGMGIDPNFEELDIHLVQAGKMNLTWGGDGSTRGGLTGASAELVKTMGGWSLSASNGVFSQSWFEGLKLVSWKSELSGKGAVISEAKLTQAGGGTAELRGSATFGENPEVTGTADLKWVRLQEFLTGSLSSMVQATATGTLEISGGLNRSSGVGLNGTLAIEGGRVTNLPVLHAVQLLTGEDTYGVLNVKSGKATFTSGGSELASGLKVELSELSLNCEPLARIKATGTFNRGTVLDLTTAAGSAIKQTLRGTIRLGLQPSAVERMKPEVAAKYFAEEQDGRRWLTIPVEEGDEPLGKALADEMIALHKASSEK